MGEQTGDGGQGGSLRSGLVSYSRRAHGEARKRRRMLDRNTLTEHSCRGFGTLTLEASVSLFSKLKHRLHPSHYHAFGLMV